jgi:hypothetical protein
MGQVQGKSLTTICEQVSLGLVRYQGVCLGVAASCQSKAADHVAKLLDLRTIECGCHHSPPVFFHL